MSAADRQIATLPGFEFTAKIRSEDLPDMTDEKRYTGEVVYRDHPEKFRAIAEAHFVHGVSIRGCAALFKVSVNTVRTIRDMALEGTTSDAGRAAFFIKSKAERLQGIIRNKAAEAIMDKLDDPNVVKGMSVDTLMKLTKLGIEEQPKLPSIPAAGEVIDIESFDDMLADIPSNGLETEKKSAPSSGAQDPEETEPETTGECSPRNAITSQNSLAPSSETHENRGSCGSLCNSLCRSVEADEKPFNGLERSPVESGARDGGRGVPGGAPRGGVD